MHSIKRRFIKPHCQYRHRENAEMPTVFLLPLKQSWSLLMVTGTKGIFAVCCEVIASPYLSLEIHIERKTWKDVKPSFPKRKDQSYFMTHDARWLREYLVVPGEPGLTLSPAQLEILCANRPLLSGPAPEAVESLQELPMWFMAEFQWNICGQFSGSRIGFSSHHKSHS